MGKHAASLSAIGGGGCNGTYVRSKKSLWAYQLGKAERKSYRSQNSETEVAFTFIVKHNCFWKIVVISLLTMHLWLSISNFAWL